MLYARSQTQICHNPSEVYRWLAAAVAPYCRCLSPDDFFVATEAELWQEFAPLAALRGVAVDTAVRDCRLLLTGHEAQRLQDYVQCPGNKQTD